MCGFFLFSFFFSRVFFALTTCGNDNQQNSSYNNVSTALQQLDNVSYWACENPETLTTDLKGRLGFNGW